MSGTTVKRIAAAVVAVGLVVGAVLIRRSWDDNSSSSTGSTGSTPSRTTAPVGTEPVVACISDLADVCNSLSVPGVTIRVEDWATTLTSFTTTSGPNPAPAAWITFDPLPTLVPKITGTTPVGISDLIAVAKADRSAAAVAACGADQFWTCIGNNAGGSWTTLGGQAGWGKVLAGFADPNTSTTGLVSLGAAASAFFGNASFGSTQIDASDSFFAWFSRMAGSVPAEALADPLPLLLQRPSAVGVVATTRAEYALLAAKRTDAFPATYPGPMARAEVVLAVTDGNLPSGLAGSLAAALEAAGWEQPAAGAATGLPSAVTLVRLQQLWKETRG